MCVCNCVLPECVECTIVPVYHNEISALVFICYIQLVGTDIELHFYLHSVLFCILLFDVNTYVFHCILFAWKTKTNHSPLKKRDNLYRIREN